MSRGVGDNVSYTIYIEHHDIDRFRKDFDVTGYEGVSGHSIRNMSDDDIFQEFYLKVFKGWKFSDSLPRYMKYLKQ